MSYFTQMFALTVQNFVSAATGIAVLIAFIRGFVRKSAGSIGNFWVDLVRATLYVMLPLAIVVALLLVSQGVVQTFSAYVTADARPADRQRRDRASRTAAIAVGPAASQIAIKQLGTNGGGFFNVNSAHPFENPDADVELRRAAFDPADLRRRCASRSATGRRHASGLRRCSRR